MKPDALEVALVPLVLGALFDLHRVPPAAAALSFLAAMCIFFSIVGLVLELAALEGSS